MLKLKVVDFIENAVMLLCFSAALALGVYQVILRYVFSRGYQWMEGTIVLLTVWAALFGGSRAIRDRIHARVGVLVDGLPPRPRQIINLFVVALCIGFCLAMFVFGYKYVAFLHSVGSRSLRVQIPTWQVFLIVPTFLGFYTIRYVVEFVNILRRPDSTLSAGLAEEVSEEFVEEQLQVRDEATAGSSLGDDDPSDEHKAREPANEDAEANGMADSTGEREGNG
jgi:TRAP-type C4-dicarboxylate transport system permease small subunit